MVEPDRVSRTDSYTVALVGQTIVANSELTKRIHEFGLNVVTAEFYSDFQNMNWEGIQVVVFECDDRPDETIAQIKEMKNQLVMSKSRESAKTQSQFDILLLNGGLDKLQLAKAWQAGIKDFFNSPYDMALIAERIHFLVKARSTKPRLGKKKSGKSNRHQK